MTINANIFVDVNVQLASALPDRFSFGTALFVCEQTVDLSRYSGPYSDITEVEAAGFTVGAAPNVHAAATAFFGVANSGDAFAVGRRIGTAGSPAQAVLRYDESTDTYTDVTTAFNAGSGWSPLEASEAADDATYYIMPSPFSGLSLAADTQGVGGTVAWEYWDGNAWTAIAGITDGTVGYTAAGTQTISFTPPINWAASEVDGEFGYAIRSRVLTVYSTNPTYLVSFVTGDASWVEALSAIVASAGADSFYWFAADTKVKADIEAIAAWTEARDLKRYVAQSSDLALLAATPGNVGEVLNAAEYKQTILFYRSVSSGTAGYCDCAAMGKLAGFDLDAENGNQPLIFQTLEGQLPDSITTTQANYLHSIGVNVYATALGQTFVSKGTASAGAPWYAQIQTTLDYADRRLTEDLLAYLVGTKPPMSNFGIQGGAGVIQERLEQMVANGMLSPDFPRIVRAPDIRNVSAADRAAGIVRYTVEAVVLNSIVKIFVDVKFTF
jgi:hypothetical protein